MTTDLTLYADLLGDIKTRIRQAQIKATLSANAEMILMYWDIGRLITERQQREGWGAAVIPRLSRDLRNDLPEEKGFSERNIGYMIRLARNMAFRQFCNRLLQNYDQFKMLISWKCHSLWHKRKGCRVLKD